MLEELPGVPIVLALNQPGFNEVPQLTGVLKPIYVSQGLAVVSDTGFALLPDGMEPAEVRKHVVQAKRKAGV